MTSTTMREKMIAFFQGKKLERALFIQYDNIAAPNKEIWSKVGRDNMGVLRWTKIYRFIHPNCRFETQLVPKEGLTEFISYLITPKGTLTQHNYFDPIFGSKLIRKHFIETVEDCLIFRDFLKDIIVDVDDTAFVRTWHQLGDDGLPMVSVERTPYQQLWIQWISLMDLSAHMVDVPDIMEEIIELLKDIGKRTYNVVYKALERLPIPFVNIPDNITAPAIGLNNFRKYCLPLYKELVEMMDFKKIPVVVHMDGDIKPLWEAIGESEIFGIDSFSPPPDNDTSVAQAVSMWPDMRLMINFPSSIHLASPEEIYEKTMQILTEGAHTGHIWIQISENVPPGVWEKSYPQIVRAIQNYSSNT